MNTCQTCHRQIRVCEDCGGLICSADCPDRAEDGCLCDEIAQAEAEEEENEEEK